MAPNEAGAGKDFSVSQLAVIHPIAWEGLPVPGRKWLWPDWIPLGSCTALYGDGGVGKSLLTLQLMVAAATGKQFLGQQIMKCKVLGMFCEDDPDELHRRLASVCKAMNVSLGDLDGMQLLSRVGSENLLMTFSNDGIGHRTVLYDQVFLLAKDSGAQLIVIDTAADTFGGNENIRPQVRQFISSLNHMAQIADAAVLLLAHPSQTGKKDGTGDGGSTAWNNSVRSRLYFRKPLVEPGQAVDPDARILSREKANYASAGAQFHVFYKAGSFAPDAYMNVRDQVNVKDRRLAAKEAFLDGMRAIIERGERCNTQKNQTNYAPKMIRGSTDAGGSFELGELVEAMQQLLKEKRILVKTDGSPSRARTYLEIVPDLDLGA